MDDILSRFWNDMVGRLDGPFHFRFILQPLMASFFAIRDGVRDAHTGRPAFLWSLFTEPAFRRERIRDGWKSVGRIFFIGIAMDVVYQFIELRSFRPMEMLLTAVLLAIVPYVLLRGPIKRLASAFIHRKLVERPHH